MVAVMLRAMLRVKKKNFLPDRAIVSFVTSLVNLIVWRRQNWR